MKDLDHAQETGSYRLRRHYMHYSFFFILQTSFCRPQAEPDPSLLKDSFAHLPDNSRILMRRWWFGLALSKPEIKRELEQMKSAGFGGVGIATQYPLGHPPYSIDLTKWLKPGTNELIIVVGNTAVNSLAGQTLPDYRLVNDRYGERFVPQDMDHRQPLPSGIVGRLQLRVTPP